jgi:hypothetical protein
MTKKHFEIVASTIAAMPSHAPMLRTQKRSCALAFADRFQAEFPRFNRDTFLKACGEA